MWLLSARYCSYFGLHTRFCFGVEADVEIAAIGFVDCCKIWVGETTYLPLCSTSLVCYAVSV